jgi:hypothetical protein
VIDRQTEGGDRKTDIQRGIIDRQREMIDGQKGKQKDRQADK